MNIIKWIKSKINNWKLNREYKRKIAELKKETRLHIRIFSAIYFI